MPLSLPQMSAPVITTASGQDMYENVTGAREWSDASFNFCSGCINGCKGCWASKLAENRGQVERCQWADMNIKPYDIPTMAGKIEYWKRQTVSKVCDGWLMFPSTHDIFSENIDIYLVILKKLVQAGQQVLVVTKSRKDCMSRLLEEVAEYRELIDIRITIDAKNNDILRYWNGNAPLFEERFECLKMAYEKGFTTSISMEPNLDSANTVTLVRELKPYVRGSIWIGKLDFKYVPPAVTPMDEAMYQAVREGQTDEKVREIFAALKDDPQIWWKESYRKVIVGKLHRATREVVTT